MDEILQEAKDLITKGFKELVLNGINISDYNNNGVGLGGLIKNLTNLKGDFRIRIGSLEPHNFDDDFYNAIRSSKVCPHFHISLQSGSNTILTQMNRKYKVEDFKDSIEKIRIYKEKPFISTDIICGFPGERMKILRNHAIRKN